MRVVVVLLLFPLVAAAASDWRAWIRQGPAYVRDKLGEENLFTPDKAATLKEVRSLVQAERDGWASVLQHIAASTAEVQQVAPAVQWAQSNETVFVQVKLAARWTSPGALTVENDRVKVERDALHFSGTGSHSGVRKHYLLALRLRHAVVPELSKWSWGSLGKLAFTLQKEEPNLDWTSLTADDDEDPEETASAGAPQPKSSITQWWEMQDALEQKAKDAAAKTNKTEAASPKSRRVGGEGDDEDEKSGDTTRETDEKKALSSDDQEDPSAHEDAAAQGNAAAAKDEL